MESVLYTYDVAMRTLVYTRFASILGINSEPTVADSINKGVILVPKGIAQREVAEKRDQTFLEFINVYRSSVAFSWQRQNTLIARRGFNYTKAAGGIGTIKADATDITYNMWFWSNDLDKVNLCVEKYIQWQHETPKVSLLFNDEFSMNPDLQFSPVVDESQIEDVFEDGKVWCFRMTAKVDGWLPKLLDISGPIQKIQLTTYDKDTVLNYEVIVVPGSGQNQELEAALRMFRSSLYRITGVSSAGKNFKVAKNRSSEFTAGVTFTVENSTENDEFYTTAGSTYSVGDDETTITVVEAIGGNIVDGNIYRPEATAS